MSAPAWSEMWRAFGRIGVVSFGGPAAQIAVMREELVERRGWLDAGTFARGLGFCTLLPGPEAMQLATFAGWRLHGWRGGVLAGLLFVLPGAAVMIALSALYLNFGRLPLVEAAFLGVKSAVLAIVGMALWKLRGQVAGSVLGAVVAVAAFAALYFLNAPFWLVIGGALIAGLVLESPHPGPDPGPSAAGEAPDRVRAAVDTIRTVGIWLAIWWLPLLGVILALPNSPAAEAATFFSWLAAVSFGGAYALLAALSQYAVDAYGWLTTDQMIDGLGLAETTPGPLVLVTVFAGWLGGATQGAGMALLTACVTLWATFAPCFLWIFAGAPHLERLAALPRLGAALGIVTAAVAGVIANLSVRFGVEVLWTGTAPDWGALTLAILAAAALWSGRLGLLTTLALAASGGLGIVLVTQGLA